VIPGDRISGAQRFGRGHDVGLHAVVLHGEELTGAAEAGLDLISDK